MGSTPKPVSRIRAYLLATWPHLLTEALLCVWCGWRQQDFQKKEETQFFPDEGRRREGLWATSDISDWIPECDWPDQHVLPLWSFLSLLLREQRRLCGFISIVTWNIRLKRRARACKPLCFGALSRKPNHEVLIHSDAYSWTFRLLPDCGGYGTEALGKGDTLVSIL